MYNNILYLISYCIWYIYIYSFLLQYDRWGEGEGPYCVDVVVDVAVNEDVDDNAYDIDDDVSIYSKIFNL